MLWTFGEGRSSAAVNGTDLHGNGLLNLPRSSYLQSVFFILGQANASPSNTQGGSPVRESRSPGSVRGVSSNGHSYRDRRACAVTSRDCVFWLLETQSSGLRALAVPVKNYGRNRP